MVSQYKIFIKETFFLPIFFDVLGPPLRNFWPAAPPASRGRLASSQRSTGPRLQALIARLPPRGSDLDAPGTPCPRPSAPRAPPTSAALRLRPPPATAVASLPPEGAGTSARLARKLGRGSAISGSALARAGGAAGGGGCAPGWRPTPAAVPRAAGPPTRRLETPRLHRGE